MSIHTKVVVDEEVSKDSNNYCAHICHIAQKITDPELDSTAAASSSLLFLRTDAYPSVTNLKQTCPTSIFAFIAE